ncbi:hypothetical protein [Aliiroseovarius sp. YM-037]|uniref:hypothetical protein n=1 Tax=Aliiroseovarius sp. YM-037 TaxID=3341728 RepID=UPI003A80BB46
MRLSSAALILIGTATVSLADEFDPNDHAGLCAQMAEKHEWADGSNAVSNCPCSMEKLQAAMSPERFEITIKWQLDPSSLSDLLPQDMNTAQFYDTVGPLFGAIEAKCGHMR